MTNTKQQSALNAATSLVSLMTQAQTLRAGAKAFIDTYNSENFSAVWSNLPTYAPNADGTVPTSSGSIVTDATPNTAHPTVALNKSEAQLLAGVVMLQQYLNFCQNVAVVTGQYSQNIDDLVV